MKFLISMTVMLMLNLKRGSSYKIVFIGPAFAHHSSRSSVAAASAVKMRTKNWSIVVELESY